MNGGSASRPELTPQPAGLRRPATRPFSGVVIAAPILACAVLLWWRLTSAFTFMMDDLIQFDVANRTGLSWELLTQNVFQHFGPLNRLGHLALLRWGDVDPAVGAAVAAMIVALLLAVVAWLATELGLSIVRRILLVVLVGGSVSVLDSAVWADALLHVLLALIATYVVVAAHLRAVRRGSAGWHLISVLTFAVGLLVQERTAFALPLIVLVDVLLVWRVDPWARRIRRLRAVRWPLLAMALIGAVAAVLIGQLYTSGDGRVSPGPAFRTWLLALTNFQGPQLAGYQPAGRLSLPDQLIVLAVIVAGAGSLVLMNRRVNTGPVLFFFAVFTLYWGFLVVSPMLDDVSVGWNAARLHNAAYVTVPAYLAVLSVAGPPAWSQWWAARPSCVGRAIGGMVVVASLGWAVVAGTVHADRNWDRYHSAHAFWSGVQNSRPIWSDPSVTVVPLQAPASVAGDWAVPIGQERFLLPIFDPGWAPGPVHDRLVAFTPNGAPISVVLDRLTGLSPAGGGPVPTCLTPGSVDDRFAFAGAGPVPADVPVLAHVRYTTDADGSLSALPLSAGASAPPVRPVPLTAPGGDVLVPLPIDQPDSIVLGDLPVAETTCIQSIDLVRPLAVDQLGRCYQLDPYGQVGAVVKCPDPA